MIDQDKVGVFESREELDFELTHFATMTALRGNQFGKDIYSSVIKFKDLKKFLESFPSVQRDMLPRKVASIRRYIISGLDDETVTMRFFSALTVTCKSHIFYDENSHRIAIDTATAKLSINDGQHRTEAIKTALEQLEQDFVKSKDAEKTAKIRKMIDSLQEMVIPIVIFDGLSEREEKMLFHDLNNLAQRPSRSTNIRLNQTDLYSRMSIQLADSNRYLRHYGVEVDKMSIQVNNENTILLTTVYESIKEILGDENRHVRGQALSEENYDESKELLEGTMNKMFYALPADINKKGLYMIEKSFTIKAISRFIHHGRTHLDLQLSDDAIFEIINTAEWTRNIDHWSKYNGIQKANGNIVFGGGHVGGFKAVYDSLMDKATEYIISKVDDKVDSKA